MAWYRAGTATFTNGSKNVTGAGTAWSTNVRPGDEIIGPDNISREVETVTSDTALTMVEAYSGTTAPGAAYKVKPIQGWNRDVAAQLAALINDYGGIEAALTVLSGNVGIGTASPTSRLHVAGDFRADGRVIQQRAAGSAYLVTMGFSDTLGGGKTDNLSIGNNGGGALLLHTNSTERLRIDDSGNVGIGTASITAKLDVVGAGDGGMQYRTGTRTVGIGQVAGEASFYWGSGTFLSFFSGAIRGYVGPNGTWVLSAPASVPELFVNGTIAFNLTSNTNVRISARGSDGVTRVANITLA